MALKQGDRVRTKVRIAVDGPGPGDTVVNYVIPTGTIGRIRTIYTNIQHPISVYFAPNIYPFEGVMYDVEELTELRASKRS